MLTHGGIADVSYLLVDLIGFSALYVPSNSLDIRNPLKGNLDFLSRNVTSSSCLYR